MFKFLFKMLLNNVKGKGLDLLLDIIYNTLLEYRRTRAKGDFDLSTHREQPHEDKSFDNYEPKIFH